MTAGRPALSPELHDLKGTRATRPSRAKQTDEGGEPSVPSGRPKTPKEFSELEVSCWKSALKILKARGVLSRGDGEALEIWSRTKARYITASKALEKEGLIVTETRYSKSGDPYEVRVPNPNLKIVEQCETRLQTSARALGLNPIDRTKVKQTKASAAGARVPTYPAGSIGAMMPELFDSKGRMKTC